MTKQLDDDLFRRLTENVEQASAEESEEILAEIDNMTADEMAISATKTFTA